MKIEEIHAEFRAGVRRLPALPYGSRLWQPLLQRFVALANRTPVVSGVETIDLTHGHVRLRVYVPTAGCSGAGMLWIHGGGMVVGTEKQDNRTCSNYARRLGLVVVSVGYRLAPQHPFPAANDDCFAAWQWFVERAEEYSVSPTRIIIAAESGGGSHGASLVHRIRDEGGVQPAGQVLLVPMLDDRTATDPSLDLGHYVWRWRDNRGGWRAYLGHEPGQASEPDYAVPARREDLSGLPPTWIGCGDKDLFYAEDKRYAERLREAGVEVEFVTVPGGPHGFHFVAPEAPTTQRFWDDNYRWIARILGINIRPR